MDTTSLHEDEPRPDDGAKLERWFPAETFGPAPEQRRRDWLKAEFDERKSYLIDPAFLRYVVEHGGKTPTIEDDVKPWQYKGWLLYTVQQLHERVAHYQALQQLCFYTGEEMPLEWKRKIDPVTATSKRSKKSAAGDVVMGPPMIVPRWHYLFKTFRAGRLLDEPIPEIHFYSSHEAQPKRVLGQIEKWVRILERDGAGWSALTSFVEWLGWALGVYDRPSTVKPETQHDLYQAVDLVPLMEWPSDYLGTLASEQFGGGPNAFYPTPHSIVEMMCRMVAHDIEKAGRHPRAETVLDCCLGTGRMLLHASNYSLRLHGQDIDWLVLLIAKINFALYAPWAIAPLPEEYFSENPPGPPWQLEDQHRQDVFFDEHIKHFKRLWSLSQLKELVIGHIPDEAPQPERPELDTTIDDDNPITTPAAAPASIEPPVIPASALAVPGVVSISAPQELARVVASPDADPIPLRGVQLGLFGFASEPGPKKKSRR